MVVMMCSQATRESDAVVVGEQANGSMEERCAKMDMRLRAITLEIENL